jgi:hypothetical protein
MTAGSLSTKKADAEIAGRLDALDAAREREDEVHAEG